MSLSQLQTKPEAPSRATVSPQLAARVALVFVVLGLCAPSLWVAKLALGFVLVPLWVVVRRSQQAAGPLSQTARPLRALDTREIEPTAGEVVALGPGATRSAMVLSDRNGATLREEGAGAEKPQADVSMEGSERPEGIGAEVSELATGATGTRPLWQAAIWEQSSLPLCLVDADGNLQEHNLAADLAAEVQGECQGQPINPWWKLFPEERVRKALLEQVVRKGVRHQEMQQTPWGLAQVSLSPLIDADGQGRGLVLSWVPSLQGEASLAATLHGLEDLKLRVADLHHSQERWWRQSEETRKLLEQAWLGLDLEPVDRQGWAEGSNRWKGLATECASLAQRLERLLAESCGSVERLKKELAACEEIGEKVGHSVPSLLEFSDQAKLLAFNGTIEAVGAGDAGIGFGRVATEFRDLAYDGNRKGQVGLLELQRFGTALAELHQTESQLETLVQEVQATVLNLSQRLSEQDSHARGLVKEGCRRTEATSELARTLQVVVEANRIHGAMARSLGQSIQALEQPITEWIERFSKARAQGEALTNRLEEPEPAEQRSAA